MVAEKIRHAVAATDVDLPGRVALRLTVSIGVAAYPEDTNEAAELFGLADEALYRAKRMGRDRTCMAGAPDDAPAARATTSMVQDAQVMQSESNVSARHRRSPE
jgi:predicted signal transduction protein with EAL and GGDEF domain